MELTRRSVIAAGVTTLGATVLSAPHISRAASPLQRPALPFAEDALAPTISAKTLSLHYGKHHKAYFDKLNTLTAPTKYADMDLAAIMAESARTVPTVQSSITPLRHGTMSFIGNNSNQAVPIVHKVSWLLKSVRLSVAMKAS